MPDFASGRIFPFADITAWKPLWMLAVPNLLTLVFEELRDNTCLHQYKRGRHACYQPPPPPPPPPPPDEPPPPEPELEPGAVDALEIAPVSESPSDDANPLAIIPEANAPEYAMLDPALAAALAGRKPATAARRN